MRLAIPGGAVAHLAADRAFRRGVARLGARGLPYESWHYHTQNQEFLDLARAVPGTTMVFDHFGTPLGVGPWAGRHDEIFPVWCDEVADLAGCPNVVAKLGGLAMPDNGFGWHRDRDLRPDVDGFIAAQGRWYHHAIESFGPTRCMFESNFPVDKTAVDYDVLWNALKTMAPPLRRGRAGGAALGHGHRCVPALMAAPSGAVGGSPCSPSSRRPWRRGWHRPIPD